MCDTMVVLGSAATSGRTTLAKNSDREPNEAQYLFHAPGAVHPSGASLACTYIEIPQARRTYAVLGSQPWWMWGFEHGVNECGVAIGNEAVWSRLPAGREPGLLGMDLLRLALERGATADEALAVITDLLERYGQSGRCARVRDMFYHNSFIIADPNGAWVLQTAGRHWVAKRVVQTATISNVYSIGSDYDRISSKAEAFAIEQGWRSPAGLPFDFAAAYADTTLESYPSCQARFRMSQSGMASLTDSGTIRVEDLFALLRSHGSADLDRHWRPDHAGERMLCMHACSAQGFETAASMVAELPAGSDPGQPLTYWASLASPCLSSFAPMWLDSGVPATWMRPKEGDADLWWRQERVQRQIERDYPTLSGPVRQILAQVEARALRDVTALSTTEPRARSRITRETVERHAAAWRIITDLVGELIEGPLPPDADDPRGGYIDIVNSEIPVTSRLKKEVAPQPA